MTLCNTYKRLALDTWDKIQQGRRVHFQLKEETLTDLNVLALKARHNNQVFTKVFTKNAEGKNGADWEWWFKGLTNKWIGFRVQAKVINIDSDEFEHLHYRSPKKGKYQCDKLITKALSAPQPLFPIYCLYIQTDDPQYLNKWSCRTFSHLKDFFGCSLTSAFTVKKLRPTNSKHLIDLQNKISPWHCLVCCSGYGKSDFVTNIQAFARAQFELDNEAALELDTKIPEDFSTDTPPQYVLSIIDNENNDNIITTDRSLAGVLVFLEKE
ncbi:DUF6615 family protein [Rufibacter roseolus]|uniref:DUF6615 family protein n=1 Tax=Rufibacter roseolus TaxID=2817375 RepID=UPI001B305ED1|nr:DUF6615 family protein [Rufibacter roseolus]